MAVTLDSEWANVRQFFGGTVPPEVFRDPSGALAKHCEVGALPDTYLLDADGAAKVRFGGARDWSNPAARDILARHQTSRPMLVLVP